DFDGDAVAAAGEGGDAPEPPGRHRFVFGPGGQEAVGVLDATEDYRAVLGAAAGKLGGGVGGAHIEGGEVGGDAGRDRGLSGLPSAHGTGVDAEDSGEIVEAEPVAHAVLREVDGIDTAE